jgi:hypothetical protein
VESDGGNNTQACEDYCAENESSLFCHLPFRYRLINYLLVSREILDSQYQLTLLMVFIDLNGINQDIVLFSDP